MVNSKFDKGQIIKSCNIIGQVMKVTFTGWPFILQFVMMGRARLGARKGLDKLDEVWYSWGMIKLTMDCRVANHVLRVPVVIASADEVNVNLADEPTFVPDENRIFFSDNFMFWLLRQHNIEPNTDIVYEVIDQVSEQLDTVTI